MSTLSATATTTTTAGNPAVTTLSNTHAAVISSASVDEDVASCHTSTGDDKELAAAGGKQAQSGRTSKDGEQLSEKKLRRLEKNRLSARECRRRKREATENLERQINFLEAENLRLRLQLQVGEEAEESDQREQQKMIQKLDTLLKSGASETEIYAKVEEYKEKFADYGRDKRSAIEFHMRNIERLLKPTTTTSLVLVTLQRGATTAAPENPSKLENDADTSHSSNPEATNACAEASTLAASENPDSGLLPPIDASTSRDPKALFTQLVKILEVTPEQAAALKDSRFVAQEMDECLKASLAVLQELRMRLTECVEDIEAGFDSVRSILTPTQAAKFLVWVANNRACMHMLDELWSKVYPQTIDGAEDSGEASP